MEVPVSAFAMYIQKKLSNKEKKKKKSENQLSTSKTLVKSGISKEVNHDTAKKLIKKQIKTDKKQLKTISKKKTHKKKKTKGDRNGSETKVDRTGRITEGYKIGITKAGDSTESKAKDDKTESKTKGDKTEIIKNGDRTGSISYDIKNVSIRLEKLKPQSNVPTVIPIDINKESNVSAHSSNASIDFNPVVTDSAEEGLKVFKWMIAPYNPDEFLNHIWEKKPLHIARNKSSYYNEIISTPIIDNMLRNENIQFSKNIDVTSYVNGKRETHNPEGRAYPHIVWDSYLNGCSIRLLNPQTYIPKLHLMNATLQEFFNSFVGANAYLTPPDSQGFAPHYDDIEAFILQIEGKKHWRIYKPLSEHEVLPRVSSRNFSQEEIREPIMEMVLQAGDMLYFPRGYIHQGVTIEGEHSLHITVSMYQKHAWADLFEKMVPAALHVAISENVALRQGLPFDIYDNFGLVNSDINTPRRKEIENIIKSLFDVVKDNLPIDDAVDQMNKNYQQDVLPPVLSDMEKAVTVFGDSDVMIAGGIVTNRVEMSLDTKIRLLRKNILRMVCEEQIRLYYYVENSLEYHGNELPYLEIEEEFAPAIETLIRTYPEYVSVENLEIPNDSDKLQIAESLWCRGLVMTDYPMLTVED